MVAWRYTNCGGTGGIVYADSKSEAMKKLVKKFGSTGFNSETDVWLWENDDYYDGENPDVMNCYDC